MIFLVYPGPKGSEENQFTPLGDGVNKLIFKRYDSFITIWGDFKYKTKKKTAVLTTAVKTHSEYPVNIPDSADL
jgi:hypothetical protein